MQIFKQSMGRILLLVIFCLFLAGVTQIGLADDWPNWRGPTWDGISKETGWTCKWPEKGPNQLWNFNVGTGFSSLAVSKGRVYTLGNTDNTDTVFCLDAHSGKIIWKHAYPCDLSAKYHEGGPYSTPTVDGERVYTMSKHGHLFCFNAANGKVIWERDLKKELNLTLPTWCLAGSPRVVGNVLILNATSYGIALDKTNGKTLWQNGTGPAGYGTPVVYVVKGKQYLALAAAESFAGLDLKTGKKRWEIPWKNRHSVNASDPVVIGNTVFVSSGYGAGAGLFEFQDGTVREVWKSREMNDRFNTLLSWDGHLVGFNENKLVCLNHKTGSLVWEEKHDVKGTAIIADGKLIYLSEAGELVVGKISIKGFEKLAAATILTGKCWTLPVLANGKIYARNTPGDVVCLDISAKIK